MYVNNDANGRELVEASPASPTTPGPGAPDYENENVISTLRNTKLKKG